MRQHTHDLRNGLNGFDLEAALLQEVVTEEEGRASVARLRRQLRNLADQLRSLAARFHDPRPSLALIAARELLAIWQEQQPKLPAALEVAWEDELGEETVEVDAGMIAEIFRELLVNAATFPPSGSVTIRAGVEKRAVVFEQREPKSQTLEVADWGKFPFSSTRRGGYGLGLWHAHRLAEANAVQLIREFRSPGELVTRLEFPPQ